MKYLSFDIETAKLAPRNEDASNPRPLGITCYAVAWPTEKYGIRTKVGHGINPDGTHAPKMSKQECAALVYNLMDATEKGYILLAHNGVGFDFDILAEESGLCAECAQLAIKSVDTLLHIHCVKGFPVGLDAIAKGMGIPGKPEGMKGDLAPYLWADGEHEKVLEYVAQDVRSTLEVVLAVEKRGSVKWIAKSGRLNSLAIPKWLTASESLQLPEPDTSWMKDAKPIPRTRFTDWMRPARPV